MPTPATTAAVLLSAVFSLYAITPDDVHNSPVNPVYKQQTIEHPKIQVAILLDVSNSMDGLIEQAKQQLWNIIKITGQVRCNGDVPKLEIALYEYGRSSNEEKKGYIKQICGFTNDLDKFYGLLSKLTTQGGEEYCGHVISTSVDSLGWDNSRSSYKVIFIAGNESFLQGAITFTEACKKAKQKGVIVNTIYCGDKVNGVDDGWNLGAECGNGSYTNIDQDAKPVVIPTPYDTTLFVLNSRIHATIIPYGKIPVYDTVPSYDMKQIDKVIGYVVVKADKNLYTRANWDLVDAAERDSSIIEKIDMETLPGNLKNKPRVYLKQAVKLKLAERNLIRDEISKTDKQRDAFIQKAMLTTNVPKTLRSEIEKIIRQQITRFNMRID